LRLNELEPLVDSLDGLNLKEFSYISLHAPSAFPVEAEDTVIALLMRVLARRWPIVVHPDTISNSRKWHAFGSFLCVENMDKRKPIGRTSAELGRVYDELPEAMLCFDIGHARQVDPTMGVAAEILRAYRSRIRQIHVSEVDTGSRHHQLSCGAANAFKSVLGRIESDTPLIIESVVAGAEIASELKYVEEIFCKDNQYAFIPD
jgi:hypothetical protein